jgi:hypothetical protein
VPNQHRHTAWSVRPDEATRYSVEKAVKRAKTNRHAWIVQAIQEKLQRSKR